MLLHAVHQIKWKCNNILLYIAIFFTSASTIIIFSVVVFITYSLPYFSFYKFIKCNTWFPWSSKKLKSCGVWWGLFGDFWFVWLLVCFLFFFLIRCELVAFPVFWSGSDKEIVSFWKIMKRNPCCCAFMKSHLSQEEMCNNESVYIPESARTYIAIK